MEQRWKYGSAVALAAAVGIAGLAVGAAEPRAGAAPPTTTTAVPTTSAVPDEPAGPDGEGTITVNGHGTVRVTPDVADVTMGVQTTAATAAEAMDTLAERSTALVDTLTGVGIAAEDVQTSGLSLWPAYADDGATVRGYQASTSVTVTVRDVERVGEILDAAQSFVGEELTISGIGFSYADPEAVLGEARAAAVDNARVRAEQYAAAADVELGGVVRIVETAAVGVLARVGVGQDAAAPASVAVEPGSQELGVDVTVVFAMA